MKRQRLIESYQARDKEYSTRHWCDDNHVIKRTLELWLKNPFYNLRLRPDIVDIPAWLGEGYGRVVPGNPDEEMMSDTDNLFTFATHNLEIIQVNDDDDDGKQRLTLINLPPGIIQYIEDNHDNNSIRIHVQKYYTEYGCDHTCSEKKLYFLLLQECGSNPIFFKLRYYILCV